MNVKTTISRWAKRRRFAPITAMPDLNVPPDQAPRIARWILSLPPTAPSGGASRGSR